MSKASFCFFSGAFRQIGNDFVFLIIFGCLNGCFGKEVSICVLRWGRVALGWRTGVRVL